MEKKLTKDKKISKGMSLKKESMIFYVCMVIVPVVQFCVFYIYSKVQSILLAFEEYEVNLGGLGYNISFAGFKNFVAAFDVIKANLFMIENSLIMFAVDIVVGMGLALIFSYYITKNYALSGLFKVFLFMPQVISGVVFGILYRYIVNDVYVLIAEQMGMEAKGLLENEDTQFMAVLFYNVWLGFGTRVLITSSAMSAIDQSIVESANLDGCTPLKEFFKITVPLIFPTFVTLIILGISGIFTNQRAVYTLLQMNAKTGANFGWFFFYQSERADVIVTDSRYVNYSQLSAIGLIFSVIVFALVATVKKLCNKYGPSVD